MSEDKSRKADKKNTDAAESVDSTTSTGTATLERTEASAEQLQSVDEGGSAGLTALEEKVLRMRYGRSLKSQEALEFAVDASLETRLKLALIEASLLEAFEAEALEPDPSTGLPRSVLADSFD